VVATAVVGAGIVALGAGGMVPDAKAYDHMASFTDSSRAEVAERANRGERPMGTSMSQGMPDAWVLPMHDYRLSSRFGMRWGRPHRGLDLAGLPEGTPYMAVHDGTVVQAGWNGGYGNSIIIDHGNGLQTLYGHSSRVLVKVGDQVQAGEVIGMTGNTGYSFGTHLHIEIHVDGVAHDPLIWFKKHGVDFELELEEVYGS
jgi:murein DD-endopeptidase MepM/ murein hydrolase activator NlpD